MQCAKALLINMPRPSQSGYATLPLSRPHNDEKVRAAVGYEDAAFFRGLFKRATGMTPGEYRENFAGCNGARSPVAARTAPRRQRHAN